MSCNLDDFTWLYRGQDIQNSGHEWNRMTQLGTFGLKYQDGYVQVAYLLLKSEVAIACNENVKLRFSFSQQSAIR